MEIEKLNNNDKISKVTMEAVLSDSILFKPGARSFFTANKIGNFIVIAGGINGKKLAETWEFDLIKRKWRKGMELPDGLGRYGHITAQIEKKLYLIGGFYLSRSSRTIFGQ